MDRLKTPSLLARTVNLGEADRICDLLTLARGKVSALARGARRSRKRFGGALSLFVVGEAHLSPRRSGDLMLLERFDPLEDLAPLISSDLVKVAHGSYVLELARELWPVDQPEPGCFSLVRETLRALARHPPAASLLRAFELQLLQALGLQPALERCVSCDRAPTDEPLCFNLARGGLVCHRCGSGGWPLSRSAQQALIQLAASPPALAATTEVEREVALQMRDLMLALVQHHLGRGLRSLAFIQKLRGGQATS